jgi:UDP-N-acetylglucosamine--N-acetylmuramyl-(pentapeptide) pyrophosphoryl-undecaprenol N-acetylglucosamine transferase
MRILYYAVNGRGLGHLMRLSAIAHAAIDVAPMAHQLILTGSNYPDHFQRLNVSWLVLPLPSTLPDGYPGHRFRSVSNGFLQRIVSGVAEQYCPNVSVFDTYASAKLLRAVRQTGTRVALVFRECRDSYFNACYESGRFEELDRLLIPHTKEEFYLALDLKAQTRLEAMNHLIDFVGPIVYPALLDSAAVDSACSSLNIHAEDTLILITLGGGGFEFACGDFAQNASLAAARLRRTRRNVKIVCVGGPFSRTDVLCPDATCVPHLSSLQALMARADIVVSHGGYNTVNEIMRVGARAMIAPIPRLTEDQGVRLKRLQSRPALRIVDPDEPVENYEHYYEELLAQARPEPAEFSGGRLAAESIVSLTGGYSIFNYLSERGRPGNASAFAATTAISYPVIRVSWNALSLVVQTLRSDGSDPNVFWWEIEIGAAGTDDLATNASVALSMLQGVATDRLVLSFVDSTGGLGLTDATRELANLHFASLVARVPAESVTKTKEKRSQVLESLRQVPRSFTVDIMRTDSETVICNQP